MSDTNPVQPPVPPPLPHEQPASSPPPLPSASPGASDGLGSLGGMGAGNVRSAPPTTAGALSAAPSSWPTAIGIVSIVIGALSFLTHGCGAVSYVFAERVMQMFAQKGGGATPQLDAQRQMMDAMTSSTWGVISIVASAATSALAIVLIFAGVMVLRRKKLGINLHWVWCAGRVALGLLAAMAQYQLSLTMTAAMAPAGGPAGAQAGMAFMQGFQLLNVAIMFLWILIYPVVLIIVLLGARRMKEWKAWA